MIILKLIFSWVLKFLWGKADEWYAQAQRDIQNREVVKTAVKEVVKEAQVQNETIANNPESIGQSIDRLRQLRQRRLEQQADPLAPESLFKRAADARRERADSETDSVRDPSLPSPERGSTDGYIDR